MATTELEFSADLREVTGKGAMRRLRAESKIPGVVYGDGKEGTKIQLDSHSFELMLNRHPGVNMMLNLNITGDKSRLVLLKEVQRHPISNVIRHLDFHEVDLDRRVKVRLALNFVGTPAGVVSGGGTLDLQLRTLAVECKAGEMLDSLDVDVSGLDVGDHLHVSSIELPEGFTMLTASNVSIATVLKARVKVAAAAAVEEEA